jgi:hypothetical protein
MSDLLEQLEARLSRAVGGTGADAGVTELLWMSVIVLSGLALSGLVLDPHGALALFEHL